MCALVALPARAQPDFGGWLLQPSMRSGTASCVKQHVTIWYFLRLLKQFHAGRPHRQAAPEGACATDLRRSCGSGQQRQAGGRLEMLQEGQTSPCYTYTCMAYQMQQHTLLLPLAATSKESCVARMTTAAICIYDIKATCMLYTTFRPYITWAVGSNAGTRHVTQRFNSAQ